MKTHLMGDGEDGTFPKQGCHHGMLRVGMNAATSIAKIKRIPKKWRARRFL